MPRKIVAAKKSTFKNSLLNLFQHIREKLIAKSTIANLKKTKERGKRIYRKTTGFIKRRPMRSFFISLGLLFVVLILGQIFQTRSQEQTKTPPVKTVRVYSIGEAPKATFQAKIEKTGVVKIVAQTNGVVQSITVSEGETVYQGQQIISLSSNYQGGNGPAIQRQIAQTQYQNILDTFGTQTDLINKQRSVATTSAENADKMREIARQSIDETNNQINSTQSLIDLMTQQLNDLLANNPNSSDPLVVQQVDQLQASINQTQGGLNQLRQAQRNTDFTASNDNAPARLGNLQKDITLAQLDVQEKSLGLNKEVSRLQLSLAYISEAVMYPASPFSGVVERVYVHEGELVSPGTLLATVTSSEVSATAILTIPQNIAKIITSGEPSELIIGTKHVALMPYYISSQATDGQLYSVFYNIPEEYQQDSADGEFVTINVPVHPVDTTSIDPFVPIDAVYQSQDSAFVLVANDTVESRRITLGKVYGNYVEVLKGITTGDQIILDRNVIAGDKVEIQ